MTRLEGAMPATTLVVSAVLGVSCSLIPLQAGRMDAVFHYKQTYEIGGIREVALGGQRLLTAVLGEHNFCAIDAAVRTKYLADFLEDSSRWQVNGLATCIISPSPWWTDGFVIEANGRYIIRSDSELIARSDFYIAKQSIRDIKELFDDRRSHRSSNDRDLHWIDLLIRQIVIPEPAENRMDRYVHRSDLVVRLYILPLDSEGVFAIAPVSHEIGLVSQRDDNIVDAYSVGCVNFEEPQDARKVFDVRNRDSMFRVKDYPEILRRAGIPQQNQSFAPRWYGQPCAAREPRLQYRESAQRSASEWVPDPHGEHFMRLFKPPSACPG